MSLKYVVLGLLLEYPHYGYEIKRKFENNLGDVWPISYGQLYPTLKRLTEAGYVTKHQESGKKAIDKNVYSITEKGREHFRKWFYKVPKKAQFSVKDEFSLLLMFLQNDGTRDTEVIIKRQLNLVSRIHERYKKQLNSISSVGSRFQYMVVKKMIYQIEAEIKWLEELRQLQK